MKEFQADRQLVNERRTTGHFADKKQKHKRRGLTEEKLHDIGARLEHTPRKSLKRLAQETSVSKSIARKATLLLKLGPYKNNSNPRMLCSLTIQLAGLIVEVGFCNLSSNVISSAIDIRF
jgi:hypothetical protein